MSWTMQARVELTSLQPDGDERPAGMQARLTAVFAMPDVWWRSADRMVMEVPSSGGMLIPPAGPAITNGVGYWTRALGEPDNSPSVLANFVTMSAGPKDNSPSILYTGLAGGHVLGRAAHRRDNPRPRVRKRGRHRPGQRNESEMVRHETLRLSLPVHGPACLVVHRPLTRGGPARTGPRASTTTANPWRSGRPWTAPIPLNIQTTAARTGRPPCRLSGNGGDEIGQEPARATARLRAFGGTLGLLPEPISFQASFLHDDDGALNVTYSRHALGGDILHRTLEQAWRSRSRYPTEAPTWSRRTRASWSSAGRATTSTTPTPSASTAPPRSAGSCPRSSTTTPAISSRTATIRANGVLQRHGRHDPQDLPRGE